MRRPVSYTHLVVRAVLENSLYAGPMPLKLYYNPLTCYRAEKPQAGRQREFHQFGCLLYTSRALYRPAKEQRCKGVSPKRRAGDGGVGLGPPGLGLLPKLRQRLPAQRK